MNVAKIMKLAEHIRSCHSVSSKHMSLEREEFATCFNMRYDFFDCGAPACIAGHTLKMEGRRGSY